MRMEIQYAIKENSIRIIKCEIKLKTRDGKRFIYHGLFKSTSEAIIDAINRFDIVTIFVRTI